jgi:uncharacterized SAM-binding protein YcdF (DUF218 family)
MHYKGFSIKKMIYIFIATILLSLTVLSTTFLKYIGNWLIINDKLKKVDVIIVISGDKGERLQHAVNLFHKQYADYLLVSGCNHPEHLNSYTPEMRKQAISLGVPSENIIMDLGSNSGTGDQAINVIKIMKEKKFNSAILVTSNYHTRRAKMIFQRACQNDHIELLVSYPTIDSSHFNEWWKNGFERKMVIYEIIKLVWYWFSFSGRNA